MLGLTEADLMNDLNYCVPPDFKSEQTVTHTIQTEDLACQIALRFGIEGEELRNTLCFVQRCRQNNDTFTYTRKGRQTYP